MNYFRFIIFAAQPFLGFSLKMERKQLLERRKPPAGKEVDPYVRNKGCPAPELAIARPKNLTALPPDHEPTPLPKNPPLIHENSPQCRDRE